MTHNKVWVSWTTRSTTVTWVNSVSSQVKSLHLPSGSERDTEWKPCRYTPQPPPLVENTLTYCTTAFTLKPTETKLRLAWPLWCSCPFCDWTQLQDHEHLLQEKEQQEMDTEKPKYWNFYWNQLHPLIKSITIDIIRRRARKRKRRWRDYKKTEKEEKGDSNNSEYRRNW